MNHILVSVVYIEYLEIFRIRKGRVKSVSSEVSSLGEIPE